MPNLDDHGLEVIKIAGHDVDTTVKHKDYYIQVGLMLAGNPAANVSITNPLPVSIEPTAGTTTPFTSTVGTTAISIPTVAGTVITDVMVRCPVQTPNTKKLLYSFDAGTTFFTLTVGEFIIWELQGGITQIQIKGSVASVVYEVLLNRVT